MKKTKPKNKMKIKNRVFLMMAVFCLVMIALLWLFLSVFLDDIYGIVTLRRAESTVDSIDRIISSQIDFEFEAQYQAAAADCCLVVSSITENGAEVVVNYEAKPGCAVHMLNRFGMYIMYENARAAGGVYTETITGMRESGRIPIADSIVIVKVATGADGGEYAIFLSTELEPVSAAVSTINTVLIAITAVMLCVAVALAAALSRGISRPLSRLTGSAKQLAGGDYTVSFDDKSRVCEISELGGALNHAVQQLSAVDALKTELVANISHDLRTPLTLISGYGEVMRDVPGENTPENAQIIVDEAHRLSMIVNDVLDLSKIQAEPQTANEIFSLSECAGEIVASYQKLLPDYNITISTQGDANIKGDRTKVSRLLYNLINNAVDFTGEEKAVRVAITEGDGTAKVSVFDTGKGIEQEELPHIFDKYYKGRGENLKRRGSGLGLAIVKAVAQSHGAKLGVNTGEQGSEFWVEFKTADK